METVSAAVEQCGGLTSKDICGIEYERAYESSAAQ